MSTSSRSDTTDDSIFDVEELLQIEARCRELRKEKDLLKETQSQSFDLIKRLELHVRRLNEARLDDKRQIQELKKELNNCHQEIDFLQDELNSRNTTVNYLEERVGTLEMNMNELNLLQEEVVRLSEELKKSNSACDFLSEELISKETQLEQSRLQIEKLEESIASSALEYQCEIESMRLEMMDLHPSCFKTKESNEYCQEYKIFPGSGEDMSSELVKYEELVKQLKEELKKEKLRSKEEAEDLTQEMAELRYQLTELLEEERKRRSCIEQVSLQRISKLEAQLREEKRRYVGHVYSICEA
ncbi:uncharacterized protein LOC130800413 [Amaranthus tricolor]|uniref:uncharacterized protein LOC130800413 n=1 Tax=Amaranthus tricolor TaxID=29722 RepID=UPI0025880834|nr:uncharacterized protein LOC130800413 [Amaranthus tricolor]